MMVRCPHHDDSKPSMKIYGDFAYCFCCRIQVPTKELEGYDIKPTYSEPTDVKSVIKTVKGYPTRVIRGLELPYNDKGYFIVWPFDNYYKCRQFYDEPRYLAPRGVKQPLFLLPGDSKKLVIVEGEMNALTLYKCLDDEYRVCSPGPAGNFLRYIKSYEYFKEIVVVVDHDAAGIVFGYQLKEHLLKLTKKTRLITVTKDYNQILQDDGEDAVRIAFKEAI